MRTHCVRQRKQTECVSGSERTAIASNGRLMLVCTCAECGATKTQFMRGQSGRGISKNDFACGYNLRGKRAGTQEECFNIGQVRQWGVNKLDDALIKQMVDARKAAKSKPKAEPKMTLKALKQMLATTGRPVDLTQIPISLLNKLSKRQARKPKPKLEMPDLTKFNLRPDLDARYEEIMKSVARLQKPEGYVTVEGDNIVLTNPDGSRKIITEKNYNELLAKMKPKPAVRKPAAKKKPKSSIIVTPEMIAENERRDDEDLIRFQQEYDEALRRKGLPSLEERRVARFGRPRKYEFVPNYVPNMGGDDTRIRPIRPRIRKSSI